MIFVGKRLERGKRAFDLLRCDAVSDPDIAGISEIVARHKQKLISFSGLAESVSIGLQRFYKQIKGTVRRRTGIAVGSKRAIEQRAVAFVYGDIRCFAETGRDHVLEETRRAYEAERASRA